MKKVVSVVGLGLSFLIIGYAVYLLIVNYDKINRDKIRINYENMINENEEYLVNVTYDGKSNIKCSLDNIDYTSKCSFLLKEGNYKAYVTNEKDTSYIDFTVKKNYLGTFSSTIDVLDTYYLAVGGKKSFNFTFDYPEYFDKTVTYKVEDENILKVENDVMYAVNAGTTKVTATLKDGNSKTYNVVVTDLIVPPVINNEKQIVPCNRYTLEENILLDKILESRVLEAGLGTRAGVASAARFLSLEFPYSIPYFNENGRLDSHGTRPRVDAEGRYYHKGLYLNSYKFEELDQSAITSGGPNIWGCLVYDRFISRMNKNGLTCSGFVTWAMLNGGFDVGDVGAGDSNYLTDELSDLGVHNILTYDFMKTTEYKVGDFIGTDGHAALIIGIDENNIYTAETLLPKLEVYTYDRYKGIVDGKELTYTINMHNVYPNGDGYITDMWD